MKRRRPRLAAYVRRAPSESRSCRELRLGGIANGIGRLALPAVAIAALVGCQTPNAPFDPFLAGRTTIAPPATATPAGAAPYYNSGPPTVTVPTAPGTVYSPPGAVPVAAPAAAVPNGGSAHFPRGVSLPQSSNQTAGDGTQLAAWQAPGSSSAGKSAAATPAVNSVPADSQPNVVAASNGAARAMTNTDSAVVPASYNEPMDKATIRIIEPAPQPKSATPAAATGGRLPISAPRETGPANAPRVAGGKSAGNLPELTDFPPVANAASREIPGYEYDPRYAWLKGKLEYSPSQKRWKLRYIAVEGTTDDYGGSVILPESEKLKGFEPGDFVLIQGRLASSPANGKGFSPSYSIDRIKKQ